MMLLPCILDLRSVYDPQALEAGHKTVSDCPGSLFISRPSKSSEEGRTYRSTLGRENKTPFGFA